MNQKTEFTKRCIGEAVVKLLKNTDFNHIKISDIAKTAGVSRTTFYQYYTTPYSALKDYLNIIVSEYLSEDETKNQEVIYFEKKHIIFSFNFFDQYSDYFLTLTKNKLHSILLEGINEFMINHIQTEHEISKYMLYSYGGALLNSFLKWEEDGKKEKLEDIANTLEKFVK